MIHDGEYVKHPIYLVVTPLFPSPDSWRGAYCYDFVQALRRIGRYDVRVFVPGAGPDYDYQGVHVCRFPVRKLPSAILPLLFAQWNVHSFLRKLRAEGVSPSDVVVCHGHTASCGVYPLAVKRLNPKCLTLLHHHDLASFGLNTGRLRHVWFHKVINFFQLRRMHDRMDAHVFLSRKSEESFGSVPDASWSLYGDYRRQMRGLGLFRPVGIKQAIVLHNGVDRHQFKPVDRSHHDGFVMGCIANFEVLKDHRSLLEALSRIRDELGDWRLRLIGSGPTLAACKAYVAEHGMQERVSFETEVDHTQLPEFYRSLDLFVLPSYFEGFGCVFTEAWACGTPFITCEGQGMDDMILPEERRLWLCKPMNPADLTEKILHYYKNRPEQHMTGPIDIDVLVPRFVEQVEALRKKLC